MNWKMKKIKRCECGGEITFIPLGHSYEYANGKRIISDYALIQQGIIGCDKCPYAEPKCEIEKIERERVW